MKKIRVLFGIIRYNFIYTSRNEIFPKFATFLSDMDKCQSKWCPQKILFVGFMEIGAVKAMLYFT